MKRSLVIILCFAISTVAYSQSAFEALRYSQVRPGGTARGVGVAGAFGALGGDMTGVGINPAGLAFYRKSELVVSLNFANTMTETNLGGVSLEDNKSHFSMSNVNLVLASRLQNTKERMSKWKGVGFSLGYNRLANYNSRKFYEDIQTTNSVLLNYAEDLNRLELSQNQINYDNASFEVVGAYEAFLLNPDSADATSYFPVVSNGARIDQQFSINTSGWLDELSLAIGGNYDNKVYIGALIGIPILKYSEDVSISEEDTEGEITSFNSFKVNRSLDTDGVGFNAKFGVIYRPNNWLRVGGSVHTPTAWSLNDRYTTDFTSSLDTVSGSILSPVGDFEYNLITPWRFVASVAAVIKKSGFISVDYEFVDYTSANYRFENSFVDVERSLNADINTLLRKSHNIRVGGELAHEIFRVRGGYAFSQTPLDNPADSKYDGRSHQFSFGAGIRGKKYFADFAFVRTNSKNTVSPENVGVSQDDTRRNDYVMTVGMKF